MPDPEAFYDDLADDYHVVYSDWRQSVRRQGETLDRLVREIHGDIPRSVLDCSCGIGTQAIGLALRGHEVHASDISARAVERARREATSFGIAIAFDVADMRKVADVVPGAFDIVLSCDNSLPHLLTDAGLLLALRNMRRKLTPGGLLVIGIRDYDALAAERSRFTQPYFTGDPGNRAVVLQLWDWNDDGSAYDLTLFLSRERATGWETTARTTRYRALRRDELARLLARAGFGDIRWHAPGETGHHQPIVTARGGSARPS
jgi:SAM-dependent methyltransferase